MAAPDRHTPADSWAARKPKVALLVNLIAPYRARLYESLAEQLGLVILHGDMEANRDSWRDVRVTGAASRRVAGWQLPFSRRERGKLSDQSFLHIEPGYVFDLIRERPDAIITDEMGFRTFIALAYGSLFRKPVWIWWGGTPHTERQIGSFKKSLRAITARWAKRWISYGQSSTEYLLSLGIARERIVQIQNCVDESWYSVPSERELGLEPRPVLLHVGRLVARKGVEQFFRAAAELRCEGLQFSIMAVGSGPNAANLRTLSKTLGLNNVQFLPSQSPEAMPGFYRRADVLVFPTMSDVWGLVANEAVLSGLPVLCSRYAGCAHELFDPECIFDPAQHGDFVRALRSAILRQIPRAEGARLWSSEKVGRVIAESVLEALQADTGTRRGPAVCVADRS